MVAMETIIFLSTLQQSAWYHIEMKMLKKLWHETVAIFSVNICLGRQENKYVFKYNINDNMYVWGIKWVFQLPHPVTLNNFTTEHYLEMLSISYGHCHVIWNS